ncbi:MAG TPA: PAS domain-containing protein, partial [Clostridia bacterium]|nr:PAS domain-containing protein [Clostridia bacterium]
MNDNYRVLFSEKITDVSKLDVHGLEDAEKYRLFLDLTDSIILMLDSYGRVRYINKTGCDILGYDKEYILGKEWIKHFVPREWAGDADINISNALSQDSPMESVVKNPILTAGGEVRFISWRNVSIKNSNDEITGILSSGTDITEQSKNEMRFRLADEIAGMGNWSKNLITDEYVFSDGFIKLMGYEPRTIKPDLSMLLNIVHPDDQEYTRNTILNSYKTHMGYNFVFRIIRKDGEIRHINAASMFQNDSDGNALMSYGTVVDITDLMKSKNEVIETSKSLMLAEELANVGSYVRDLETDTYTCSVGFLNILGLDTPLEPLKYDDIIAFTHPDDIERVSFEIKKALEHSDTFNFENRIVRTNGDIRYIRSKGTHLRDNKGNINKIIGTILDITDYKINEKTLLNNLRKIEQVEKIDLIGFWERDLKTGIYNCSEGFYNVCGLDSSTFIPNYENIAKTVHYGDAAYVSSVINEADRIGKNFQLTHRIIRPDGITRYIRSQGFYKKDENNQPISVMGTILDVTDYIENENRLKESYKLLEASEELAQIGRWEWDIESDTYTASEGYYRITEIIREDGALSPGAMASAVHPDDLDMVLKILNETLEKGDDFSFEHRLITQSGNLKYIKSKGTYIKDESGKPIKRIGTIIDITDYVKASEKLMENERRLTEAEITSGTGNWEWNIETDEHYMSKGLLNILGYLSMEEIPSEWKLSAIYHKRDSQRVRMIISDAINSRKDSYSYEAVIVRPDGEPRTVSVNGILIKNENGDVIKTKGTYSDITKIKEYQQQIRENEIRMQSTEDAAHIGSWERDLRTGLYVCSPGIYRITGLKDTGGYLTLDDQLSIVHPDDRSEIIETIDKALKNNEDYQLNYRIERPDGEKRNINVKAKLLKDTDGTPIKVYGTVMDVTEELSRKKEKLFLESQLRNQQKLESIGILAGGVAHEINNPINGIMNYGQLILDES